MYLARSKRGIELTTLIGIFLAVLAGGLIIGVFIALSNQANEKTSENLCRGFNAIRFGTQVSTPVGSFNVAPRACKIIDKNNLPGKDYKYHINGPKEGAKAEIRNLMAKCWWMFLEGQQQNMFESKWYNLQNGCFVCYTFSIDKDVGSFSYQEFAESMDAPYYSIDSTDRCAPGGEGGKCMTSCNINSDYFSKEVASNRCKPNEKCCIAADNRDECKNKGGQCLSNPSGEYSLLYDKWQCTSGNKCYVKIDTIASYKDYVERIGGKGKIVFGDNEDFKSGSKYAITFISPGKRVGWDLALGPGAAILTGLALNIIPGGQLVTGLVALGGIVFGSAVTINAGTVKDINYILLSKYDTVASECAIESGVGQK